MCGNGLSIFLAILVVACPAICSDRAAAAHHHVDHSSNGHDAPHPNGDPCSARPCFCDGDSLPLAAQTAVPEIAPAIPNLQLKHRDDSISAAQTECDARSPAGTPHPQVGAALPLLI